MACQAIPLPRVARQNSPLIKEILVNQVQPLIRTKNIKLIVIDSIAALFRVEYTHSQSAERATMLHSHARQLKELSANFKFPIITVNQV